ncbi:hypothetical protein GCM10009746_25200 [Microbacterium paludicola]
MSASTYRGQLERKRKQRIDAEKKAGEYRGKESKKRAESAAARAAARLRPIAWCTDRVTVSLRT